MNPGIALIVGILIGAVIVYFLMQSKVKQKAAALQQSRHRLEQLEREQEQRLNELTRQLETEYEQQLADKIERYQDKHAQQIEELESEYEARLSVLIGVSGADDLGEGETNDAPKAPEIASEAPESLSLESAIPPEAVSSYEPVEDQAILPDQTATGSTPGAPMTAAAVIPDPWEESTDSVVATPDEPSPTIPEPLERSQEVARTDKHQTLTEISETLTNNRRDLGRVLPALSKFTKDPDPTVRLAAVQVLKQVESIKAIPLLRQALRDINSDVVAAAHEALTRFKGTSKPSDSKASKSQKKLPKNR
jgi:hypothetical protein